MTSTTENGIAEGSERLGASPAAAVDAYRMTFEFAPVGILHFSLEGELLRANKYFCDFIGYTEDELKTLPRWRLVHPDDVATAKNDLERALARSGSEVCDELRFVRKTGEPAHVALSAVLAGAATQLASRFIVMVEDIEARRAAES